MSAIEINIIQYTHNSVHRIKTRMQLDTPLWLTHRIIAFELFLHIEPLDFRMRLDGMRAHVVAKCLNMNYGFFFIPCYTVAVLCFQNNEDKWINYNFDEWFEARSVNCLWPIISHTIIESPRNCAFNHKCHKFSLQDGNDRMVTVIDIISFNYFWLIWHILANFRLFSYTSQGNWRKKKSLQHSGQLLNQSSFSLKVLE